MVTEIKPNKKLQTLQRITEAVHSSLDLNKVFKEITGSIVYSLEYTTSFIFELNEKKSLFLIKSVSTRKKLLPQIEKILGAPLKKLTIPADPHLNPSLNKILNHKIVNSSSLAEVLAPVVSKEKCSLLQRLKGTKSYIVIPLLSEKEVVGGIFISSAKEKVSTEDLTLLKGFALAASTAVRNARLYQESRQAQEKFKLEKAYLDSLFESAQEGIVMTDKKGKVMRVNSEFLKMFGYTQDEVLGKLIDDLVAADESYTKAISITREVVKGKKVRFESIRKRKDGRRIEVSVLASPIIINREKVASYAIYRDITKRKQTEKQLERRAIQADLLYNVAQRVSSKLTLDTLLSEIVKAVRDAFDYYGVMLFLVDERNKHLRLKSIIGGYTDIFPSDLTVKMGEGMIGNAASTGEAQVSGDVSKNPFYIRLADEKTRSELSVPLKRAENTIGVLDIQSDEFNAFNQVDVAAMETLSSQITSAIENAWLYEQAQQEIEERKNTEQKLKDSLKEKEVLLQEIHHRVRNNLQIIISLLRLQSSQIKDKRDARIFKESQNRIKSIALIHDKLYKSKSFANIDFAQYTKSFTLHLLQTYDIESHRIKINTNLESVYFDINKAVPLGLITSELITNCLKHAFPQGRKGNIWVNFFEDKKGIVNLEVKDDGVGIPEKIDFKKAKSLGMQLINDLTKQFEGTIELDRKKGTAFKITFKK